jgi:hypothetical protein
MPTWTGDESASVILLGVSLGPQMEAVEVEADVVAEAAVLSAEVLPAAS